MTARGTAIMYWRKGQGDISNPRVLHADVVCAQVAETVHELIIITLCSLMNRACCEERRYLSSIKFAHQKRSYRFAISLPSPCSHKSAKAEPLAPWPIWSRRQRDCAGWYAYQLLRDCRVMALLFLSHTAAIVPVNPSATTNRLAPRAQPKVSSLIFNRRAREPSLRVVY